MEIGNKSRAGPDWPGQEVGDMGVGGSGTGGTCHCFAGNWENKPFCNFTTRQSFGDL